ncbi:MAG: hypothetical protein AAF416_16835 [Pseudomonadota bacterium]
MQRLVEVAGAIAGQRPTHLSEDGATLTIGLATDRLGRDRWLVVESVQPDDEMPLELMQFRHLYPIALGNPETASDLLRSLLLLNRVATFGHSGLCEESTCLYYVFTCPRPSDLSAARDIVDLVDAITTWHGDLLGRVCAGNAAFSDVMADLDEKGALPRPIVYGAGASSPM